MKAATRPVRFFVSYSHVNSIWFGRLRPVLQFHPHTPVGHVWHDQELQAGARWDREIRQELDRMDAFVCLLSYEFLASSYIMEVELPRALARHEQDGIEIVPILLYPMVLEKDCRQLHEFHPLPAWDKCWREFEREGGHYQDAHKPIRQGLWEAIERIQARPPARRSPRRG